MEKILLPRITRGNEFRYPQSNQKFTYVGPSWANRSFDSDPLIPLTNLAKEWGIQHQDLTQCGSSNMTCLKRVKKWGHHKKIIWLLCEPLRNFFQRQTDWLDDSFYKTYNKHVNMVLTHEDILSFRKEALYNEIKAVSKLDAEIGVIGAHSDTFSFFKDFSNIKVIHNSWQLWTGEELQIKDIPDVRWGADMVHILFRKYPEIEPSKHIVNEMHKMFKFWDELQEGGIFFANHPNNESTKKFAKFLLPEIERFLNT